MKDEDLWPKKPLVPLPRGFKDARGLILPLVDIPMRSAVLIRSNKGAVRANHYHKSDWHYCYMLSGEMEYYERPVGGQGRPTLLVAKAGDLVFTPPGVEHAMRFTKKTDWLVLSRNPRDQASYEADVVRVKLIE